jgi:hypothetical protein
MFCLGRVSVIIEARTNDPFTFIKLAVQGLLYDERKNTVGTELTPS